MDNFFTKVSLSIFDWNNIKNNERNCLKVMLMLLFQ